MKVRRKDEKTVCFAVVEDGEVFLFNGEPFVKTVEADTAASLNDGRFEEFECADNVIILKDAELVY